MLTTVILERQCNVSLASKQHAVETYGGRLRSTSTLYRSLMGGDEKVKFVLSTLLVRERLR
jgi:hypothetical protein